jgi:hypothetical protein
MSAFRRNQSHVPYKGASPLKSKVKHVHLMLKAVLSGPSLINGSKKVPNDSHLSAMIFTVSVPNGRFAAALLRRPRNSAVNLLTQWSSIELYSGDKAFFRPAADKYFIVSSDPNSFQVNFIGSSARWIDHPTGSANIGVNLHTIP